MTIPKLDRRLRGAADYVRENAFVADVGTDHAYLPIALLLEGKIRGGVVSDINEGPILRAKENMKRYGVGERLIALRCDGLSALHPYDPEDILILGMGGELITGILRAAPWVKDGHRRLILQPMTHPEILRRFLLTEGYSIVDETLVREDKIYGILCAEYVGETERYDDLELLFGRENLRRGGELIEELLLRWERVLGERVRGKRVAGADTSEEDELLRKIEIWKRGE